MSNLYSNFSPLFIDGDSTPSHLSLCGAESWFVQVTVVPFAIVRVGGLKAKFWIVIASVEAVPAEVPPVVEVVTPEEVPAGAASC